MKCFLQLKKLCKCVQMLRDFVNNDGVCEKCLELLLCEIIEKLGQNRGKISTGGVEAEMAHACGGH